MTLSVSPTADQGGQAGQVPLLLTYRQAAKALAIGERTLASLVAAGKIKPVRIGSSVRFSPDALRAFCAAQQS